jgi:hypothetical protein
LIITLVVILFSSCEKNVDIPDGYEKNDEILDGSEKDDDMLDGDHTYPTTIYRLSEETLLQKRSDFAKRNPKTIKILIRAK